MSNNNNKEHINKLGELKNPRTLAVDRNMLSEASQRSAFLPEIYTSRIERCIGCGVNELFSAEDQKQWYEKAKNYIFGMRSRCKSCQKKWKKLKIEISEFPKELRCDCTLDDLENMLATLIEYERISETARPDIALFHRIYKKINEIERRANVPDYSSPIFEKLGLLQK